MKPQGNEKADARSLVRFFIRREIKEKSCFPTGTIYGLHAGTATSYAYFTATKINWAISNGDVIVTNFEYAYDSTLVGKSRVLKSSVTSWRWCVNRRYHLAEGYLLR